MTTPKQAKNSRFQKGSGLFKCRCCGHNTRSTGNGDNEFVRLCTICYDIAGIENAISDGCATEADLQFLSNLQEALKERSKLNGTISNYWRQG